MEKKSERLEVRLGYKEKQEFSDACETQGDTPSGAIRRFISGYIRRADADLWGSAWRSLKHKKLIFSMSAALAVFAVGFSAYKISLSQNYAAATLHGKIFALYDKDSDGVLQLGDLAPADEHVHKVLDIDGVPGISRQEFWANGRMIYGSMSDDNIIFDDIKLGSVTINNDYDERFIVVFDFRNKTSKLAVYEYATDEAYIADYDRTVIWAGKSKPSFYIHSDGYEPRT